MRNVTFLLTSMWLLLAATYCDAGGLFRRVPEVGEWAAFDWSLGGIDSRGERDTPESHYTLTIKCVGEETIEDRRHLWIECRLEWPSEEGVLGLLVYKMLVPEDVLANGEPSLDGIRGWLQRGVTPIRPALGPIEEPLEFSIPDDELGAKELLTFILLGEGEPDDSEPGERTIEVDGQEHVLTRSESGPMPRPYEEYRNLTSEGTWWLSEDLAFGVAAAEIITSHAEPEREDEGHGKIRFDLIATGTDAVSDLPDHN